MKVLFGFNLIIYLATLVGFASDPVAGSISMGVMGALNIIQSLVSLGFLSRMNKNSKRHFSIYGILTVVWLVAIGYLLPFVFDLRVYDFIPLPPMIIGSMVLGAYFVFVNYALAFKNKRKDVIF